MARRTRRPTVVWLPLDITNRIQEPAAANSGLANAGFQIGLNATGGANSGINTQVWPIVKDEPQNIAGLTETLSDLEGSAYRLRRIVGKIFVQPPQTTSANANDVTSWMVTVGFIILRVDNTGAILAPLPQYAVNIMDATRDPWIWRRSWCVSNQVAINQLNTAVPDTKQLIFPSSNVNGYGGGVADGPHVDAKTARLVSDEERLFGVISAIGLDGNTQGDDQVIGMFGELRILASMRKQSGNRRNASR